MSIFSKSTLTVFVLSLFSAYAVMFYDFSDRKLTNVFVALIITALVSAAVGLCGLIWGDWN